jgi:hypothetical protein
MASIFTYPGLNIWTSGGGDMKNEKKVGEREIIKRGKRR